MTANAALQCAVYFGVLLLLAAPLGSYLARVYQGQARLAERILGPLERLFYRLAAVRADEEMSAKRYLAAVLWFNALGIVLVYVLLRLQAHLPLNPARLPGVPWAVALNTAVSFATNTNWQAYSGETTLSPLSQMLALTVQNFVSAATGMAVLVALIRGLVRRTSQSVGSFWVDLTRSTLYVLLPLSLVLGLVLISQGVVQTWHASTTLPWLDPTAQNHLALPQSGQPIALGPVASQIAIKQLGTNGGGYFNANAAHPFENPTALSNFLELLAILLLPCALCFTFGALVEDRRQGRALLGAMLLLILPPLALTLFAEQAGNPMLAQLHVDTQASPQQAGGNMHGKETRFGIVASALWATATTAASSGSVNAMHDSFTPLGGLGPMALIQLGEIVFGGVGSGLYGMLIYALIAVFIAGLMVGRTPEYLGKKVEAFDIQMAALVLLLPAATVLLGTAVACLLPAGTAPLGNPGAHGFSEILYAFSSAGNNNGSAFAGLDASGTFYTLTLALAMLIGRYGVIVPVLLLAGSLARKKTIPAGPGTLATHTPLFVVLLCGTVLLVGALTFIPALALGPLAEHLTLHRTLP